MRRASWVMVISRPQPLPAVAGMRGGAAPSLEPAFSTTSVQRPARSFGSAPAEDASRTAAITATLIGPGRMGTFLTRRAGRCVGVRRPHGNERVFLDTLPELAHHRVDGGDDPGIEVLDVGLLLGIAPQVEEPHLVVDGATGLFLEDVMQLPVAPLDRTYLARRREVDEALAVGPV